jgi:hypothetical protein
MWLLLQQAAAVSCWQCLAALGYAIRLGQVRDMPLYCLKAYTMTVGSSSSAISAPQVPRWKGLQETQIPHSDHFSKLPQLKVDSHF